MPTDIALTDSGDLARDGTGDLRVITDDRAIIRQQASLAVARAIEAVGGVSITPERVRRIEGRVRDELQTQLPDGPVSVSVASVSPQTNTITLTATVGETTVTTTNGI